MVRRWRRTADLEATKWQPPKQKLQSKHSKSPSICGSLADKRARVRVRLTDNQEIDGKLEFYDEHFIRLTRDGEPNLFLYKHDIKYLYELS